MSNITTTGNQSRTESAKDKASEVAGTARDETRDVASTAKEEASGVVQDAKGQARRIAGESREQLRQQATDQAHRLAQSIRDVGDQLHGMASGGRAPSGLVADVTQQASSSAHRMAQKLDQRGIDGVMSDVKRFARERPLVFIAGALGAGVLAGRLFRSLDTSAIAQAAKPNGESSQTQTQTPGQMQGQTSGQIPSQTTGTTPMTGQPRAV
jgi:uncharacterized protein YjbJ (UPF0337 family)